ncbi:enhancer of polycomb-like-domain-containing protein [Astrocystis sublimbata]|nr:enhancer of polycomb-like-domain-containing protein [Astrocystis sublimbata]
MTTRKVRYKKLNIKTPLPVLREHQIDANEYESLTNDAQIATGVEQAEENEYHLQAALKGVGASVDNEIPVPPPQKSVEADFDELYPTPYVEPRNYIKSSDTVEETLKDSLYDMTTEDDEFLKIHNSRKPTHAHLSENDFERIMEVFEDTAAESTPFAEVDNTSVPFEMMSPAITHHIREKAVQAHVKAIYEHWSRRRQAVGNKSLHPSLKFETHQEQDDMDPYVCFRRREVRQTRKTRARDVQVADKLKKLRRELEDGRQLVVFSHRREVIKRELLKTDKLVYEQRGKLKETKIKLNIKADDDDLVNTKPQKRPKTEPQPPPRAPSQNQLRLAVRPDGNRSMEPVELALLRDKQAERQRELLHNIELKVQEHRRWNSNYIDLTADPLPPMKEEQEQKFRPAKTTYLMTPPASASDSMEIDDTPLASEKSDKSEKSVAPFVFQAASPEDSDQEDMPSFRRRVGRLGRLFIDRRPGKLRMGLSSPVRESSSFQSDQWKYDDDDDDDEMPVYRIDTNSLRQMRFRSTIPPPAGSIRRPDLAQLQTANRPVLPQGQALMQAAQAKAQALAAQGQGPSPTPPVVTQQPSPIQPS